MKYFLIILSLFIGVRSAAQNAITGLQFKDASFKSVDVMSSHLLLLQSHAHYGKPLKSLSLTERIAPVNLLVNTGNPANGTISRLLLNTGLGYGTIDKFGVYGGGQFDYIFARGSKVNDVPSFVRSDVIQGLWYFGISLYGFQLDVGSLEHGNEIPLDNNFDFAKDTSQVVKAPVPEFEKDMTVYTLYHKSGANISAVFSKVLLDGREQRLLKEYKINIQPFERYLPDAYGLPFFDLIGYSPFSAYSNKYDDTNADVVTQANDKSKGYDITLGTDDIAKKGIRVAFTTQIRPEISFRKLELAYNYFRKQKTQVFGSRFQFYMVNGSPKASFDAVVCLSGPEKNGTISFSYSYNSPDNVTFLPLSNLHVIGAQLILGKRETAKAIIPYAASIFSSSKYRAKELGDEDYIKLGEEEDPNEKDDEKWMEEEYPQ